MYLLFNKIRRALTILCSFRSRLPHCHIPPTVQQVQQQDVQNNQSSLITPLGQTTLLPQQQQQHQEDVAQPKLQHNVGTSFTMARDRRDSVVEQQQPGRDNITEPQPQPQPQQQIEQGAGSSIEMTADPNLPAACGQQDQGQMDEPQSPPRTEHDAGSSFAVAFNQNDHVAQQQYQQPQPQPQQQAEQDASSLFTTASNQHSYCTQHNQQEQIVQPQPQQQAEQNVGSTATMTSNQNSYVAQQQQHSDQLSFSQTLNPHRHALRKRTSRRKLKKQLMLIRLTIINPNLWSWKVFWKQGNVDKAFPTIFDRVHTSLKIWMCFDNKVLNHCRTPVDMLDGHRRDMMCFAIVVFTHGCVDVFAIKEEAVRRWRSNVLLGEGMRKGWSCGVPS